MLCTLCRLAPPARTLSHAGPLECLSDKYGQSCLSALLLHDSSEPALYSQRLVYAQRGPCKHTLKRQKHCQASTEKNAELDVPEDDVDIEVNLAYQLTYSFRQGVLFTLTTHELQPQQAGPSI